ncbi:hypothetical protein DFH06DRAFT_1135156 [Mycena polygramma]|nr:hypothetical protein DFH06DRAFT_1135156 [Mycena polygramma]
MSASDSANALGGIGSEEVERSFRSQIRQNNAPEGAISSPLTGVRGRRWWLRKRRRGKQVQCRVSLMEQENSEVREKIARAEQNKERVATLRWLKDTRFKASGILDTVQLEFRLTIQVLKGFQSIAIGIWGCVLNAAMVASDEQLEREGEKNKSTFDRDLVAARPETRHQTRPTPRKILGLEPTLAARKAVGFSQPRCAKKTPGIWVVFLKIPGVEVDGPSGLLLRIRALMIFATTRLKPEENLRMYRLNLASVNESIGWKIELGSHWPYAWVCESGVECNSGFTRVGLGSSVRGRVSGKGK